MTYNMNFSYIDVMFMAYAYNIPIQKKVFFLIKLSNYEPYVFNDA